MTEHSQHAGYLAGVGSYGNPSVIVITEDRVQGDLRSFVLTITGLACDTVPVWIDFREAFFDVPVWEEVVDVRLAASPITSVQADVLAEELLDSRYERIVLGRWNVSESEVSRPQASSEWR